MLCITLQHHAYSAVAWFRHCLQRRGYGPGTCTFIRLPAGGSSASDASQLIIIDPVASTGQNRLEDGSELMAVPLELTTQVRVCCGVHVGVWL